MTSVETRFSEACLGVPGNRRACSQSKEQMNMAKINREQRNTYPLLNDPLLWLKSVLAPNKVISHLLLQRKFISADCFSLLYARIICPSSKSS